MLSSANKDMLIPRSPCPETPISYKIHNKAQSFFIILNKMLINLCKSTSRKKKECLHEIHGAKKIDYT